MNQNLSKEACWTLGVGAILGGAVLFYYPFFLFLLIAGLPFWLPVLLLAMVLARNRRKAATPDILLRLGALAAINLVLCWLPIYYRTTYAPSGDDRDGFVLFPAMLICPISWGIGIFDFARGWKVGGKLSSSRRFAFFIASLVFLLAILSTAIALAPIYRRMIIFATIV